MRVYTDLDQLAQNDEIHRRDAEFTEFLRVSRRSLRLFGEKKCPVQTGMMSIVPYFRQMLNSPGLVIYLPLFDHRWPL
jgi:hypothetical protein